MNIRDYPTKIHTRMQTTYPQPKKRNSPRCSHSHTLYNFPTHNRHSQNGISTVSQEYLNILFLWTTKNTQAKLSSLPYLFPDVMVQLTIFHPILPILSSL